MKMTRCEGCGFSTREGEERHDDVRSVEVRIAGHDGREWADRQDESTFKADLCRTCRGQMLAGFFGVTAGGRLEIPSFILPVRAAS